MVREVSCWLEGHMLLMTPEEEKSGQREVSEAK